MKQVLALSHVWKSFGGGRARRRDIDIAVADDGFDGFAASWRDWLAAITPTLAARPLTPGSFYALTPPPIDPPPDPAVITNLIEEALRQAANFPTVLVRDYLREKGAPLPGSAG